MCVPPLSLAPDCPPHLARRCNSFHWQSARPLHPFKHDLKRQSQLAEILASNRQSLCRKGRWTASGKTRLLGASTRSEPSRLGHKAPSSSHLPLSNPALVHLAEPSQVVRVHELGPSGRYGKGAPCSQCGVACQRGQQNALELLAHLRVLFSEPTHHTDRPQGLVLDLNLLLEGRVIGLGDPHMRESGASARLQSRGRTWLFFGM